MILYEQVPAAQLSDVTWITHDYLWSCTSLICSLISKNDPLAWKYNIIFLLNIPKLSLCRYSKIQTP